MKFSIRGLVALGFRVGTGLAIVAPASSARATPRALATNLQDAVTYAGPPAGFDPVAASDAELQDYVFPPRPPTRGTGEERRRWERFVRQTRTRIMPVLEQTHNVAGPPRGRSKLLTSNVTTQNWSGEVIQTNAHGYGPGAFYIVTANYNLPIASQAFGACTGGVDSLFTWVGIDGWTNESVFQAGTEADASCVYGYTSRFYSAWYEWYPNYEVRITNLAVAAGDAMGVLIYATSATSGLAWILNATSGNYVVIGFNAPAGVSLRGDSAEWIEERPSVNGALQTLTNYVQAWMSDAGAVQLGGSTFWNFGAPPPGATVFNVTMTDNLHNPISSAAPLGGNALSFTDSGSAK